jgi:glutathione S-transferase
MKLIGSLSSPYVRKVRVVMAEKKIDYQMELDNVWAETSHIQDFNPLGKVPCLVMEDGGAMFDSRVIVEYLDTLTPVGKLLPVNGRERAEVKCWEALADGVLDAAIAIRLETTMRPAEAGRWESMLKRQRGKIDAGLAAMSLGLGDKQWCTGERFSLADVAVGCALGYLDFRFGHIDWRAAHPNLARLEEKLRQRSSFGETVPQG